MLHSGGAHLSTMVGALGAHPNAGRPNARSTRKHGSVHPMTHEISRMIIIFLLPTTGAMWGWICSKSLSRSACTAVANCSKHAVIDPPLCIGSGWIQVGVGHRIANGRRQPLGPRKGVDNEMGCTEVQVWTHPSGKKGRQGAAGWL